uniref:Uncharacterized protein n=1 Tax=Sphaerodactylus townsendi TaxID=933632 RepID=A0ACB8FZC0_9SAUR
MGCITAQQQHGPRGQLWLARVTPPPKSLGTISSIAANVQQELCTLSGSGGGEQSLGKTWEIKGEADVAPCGSGQSGTRGAGCYSSREAPPPSLPWSRGHAARSTLSPAPMLQRPSHPSAILECWQPP